MSRIRIVIASLVALALLGITPADAHNIGDAPVSDGLSDGAAPIDHHQHGGGDGHLAASSHNVTVVGSVELSTVATRPGTVADVAVHNGYAYLGRFRYSDCAGPESGAQDGGVWVVDIRNPSNPVEIGFIDAHQDAYVGEGVQALRIDTPKFAGDLLVVNNEACGDQFKAGVSLYDVTNPARPKRLVENFGDFDTTAGPNTPHDANQIHSAFAWDAGDRAYVVMVDDMEALDVDILDVTNPRKPVLIAEHDFNALFPQIIDPVLGANAGFLHDMVVVRQGDKWIMVVSYWDSGYLLVDVTDPRNPTYVADSDFAEVDPELLESPPGLTERPEGNAHQAELSLDQDFLIGADEDFGPTTGEMTNTTDGTPIDGSPGNNTPPLAAGTTITGQAVYVGQACTAASVPVATASTQIAIVERGVCTFTAKNGSLSGKGYAAAIVFNREGPDGCSTALSMDVAGDVTMFGVATRSQGYALFNTAYNEASCLAGPADGSTPAPIVIGTLGDAVRIRSIFDGWGYVHLYQNGSGKLTEIDTYAIPEAHDPLFATGFGDLSVHEVAMSHVDNNLGYLSYYSGGFRVIEVDSTGITEVGHFIAPGGNNFWGVQVFSHGGQEYVAASDRDFGLYIFQYTP